MTPQERAKKVVEDVREHKMFNVDTDGTWERYIASAIKCALEDTLPDVNDLDDVVHELGIEDSHVTPAEAIKNIQTELATWRNVAQRAGICMSCALGTPEPFGCTDCLNTGWNGGAPAGFIPEPPKEPGTCKCGAAPINKDGMCATCADAAQPKLESETIQILLDLLNPLHGEIDRQTYDERYKQGFDAPADAEYNIDITARMERDLTQAVLILEDRRRSSR